MKQAIKNAARHGKTMPKAVRGVAKSLGSGDSPAKAILSGGVSALKETGQALLGKKGGNAGQNKAKIINIVEEIDIGAARRLVYDQWTRFQDFPAFTKKVESTDQVSDEKLQWKAKIFWSTRVWESTIVEQVPDERVVWRSKGAKGYVDGAVTFHELSPDLTRVLLVLEYHPQGLFEKTGNLWRAQGRRARLELKHFRRHVMTKALLAKDGDVEGWRGEIHDSEVVKTHDEAVGEEKKQQGNGRKQRGTTRSGNGADSGKSSGGNGSSRGKRSSSAKK